MFVSTNKYYVRYFDSLARPKQKAQNIMNIRDGDNCCNKSDGLYKYFKNSIIF